MASLFARLSLRGAAALAAALAIAWAWGAPPVAAQGVTLEQAIELILTRNPQIGVQRARVDEARGAVKTTEGAFDWALAARLLNAQRREGEFSTSTGDETQLQTLSDELIVQGSRFFTNGWTLTLRGENLRARQRGRPYGPIGRAEPSATVTVPLLRNFGSESATASKREAIALLASVRLDSLFQVTSLIQAGIVGYWNSRALDQNIATLEETARTQEEIAIVLKDYSDNGEISSLEYQRAQANLRRRQLNVLAATRDAYRAREELALILGVDSLGSGPRAVTPFPELRPEAEIERLNPKELVDVASTMRLDLGALHDRFRAQEINLAESVGDLRPQLDLGMTLGYSASRRAFSLSEFDELYFNQSEKDGPNYTVALTMSYPLGNNAAEGRAATSRATLSRVRGEIDTLKNTIRGNVSIAVNELKMSLQELTQAREALSLIQGVSGDMTRKLYLGESSLTDFIDVQDELTQSRLDVVNATRNYAIALAALRFQTGTLGVKEGDSVRVESYMFNTLPQPAETPLPR